MITTVLSFFLSPVGRYIGIGLIALIAVGGWGEKRYWDGRAAYKAKIERQIKHAVEKGDDAKAKALKEFDSHMELPDDGRARD